jgi:hypothetical protein
MPAQAGIHLVSPGIVPAAWRWIPAFAGMTPWILRERLGDKNEPGCSRPLNIDRARGQPSPKPVIFPSLNGH